MGPVERLGSRLFELKTGGARILPMEGMRGLSAFIVFFVHFKDSFGPRLAPSAGQATFYTLAESGRFGVDVFFALSGYIIYSLLLAKPAPYVPFVRRRLARIYPAFAAVFLLYLGISLALPGTSKIPESAGSAVWYLTANFLMLPGMFPVVPMITVAWSLSYELCFYLSFPLMFRAMRLREWSSRARAGFFVCLFAGWMGLWFGGVLERPQMVMFICGILLRELPPLGQWRIGWNRNLMMLGAVVALCILSLGGHGLLSQLGALHIWHHALNQCLRFLSVFALGCFVFAGDGWLSRAMCWNWARWFGNMSYSYYLVHSLVLHGLRVGSDKAGLPAQIPALAFVGLSVVCFAATVVGGAALFLTVEKPLSFGGRAGGQERVAPGPAGSRAT